MSDSRETLVPYHIYHIMSRTQHPKYNYFQKHISSRNHKQFWTKMNNENVVKVEKGVLKDWTCWDWKYWYISHLNRHCVQQLPCVQTTASMCSDPSACFSEMGPEVQMCSASCSRSGRAILGPAYMLQTRLAYIWGQHIYASDPVGLYLGTAYASGMCRSFFIWWQHEVDWSTPTLPHLIQTTENMCYIHW